jgi:hypothetical protein
MAGMFRRALVQLVQVGYFQSGLFLLGMAVAQPPQTAISPKGGSPCIPSPMHFSKLTETTVRMLLALMSAMVAAMVPILWLPEERPLNGDGRSVRVVRYLRAAAFLAVSFSLLAMLLGFIATYQILVVKTSLSSCWTRTTTATVIGFYTGATLVCSGYYVATYGVVLFSD